MPETPIVSVVIVNYRGAEDTIRCLRDFAEIDWPQNRLELVVAILGAVNGVAADEDGFLVDLGVGQAS